MKNKKIRPSERARLLALKGAVLIEADNHFVVLKPFLARQVAQKLAYLANLAESAEKDPSMGNPADEFFKNLFKKGN